VHLGQSLSDDSDGFGIVSRVVLNVEWQGKAIDFEEILK
jgi:hypothetical protein